MLAIYHFFIATSVAHGFCGTCCTACMQRRTTCPSLPFEYQMLLIASDLLQLCWIASEANRVESTTPRRTFPSETPSASVSHNENVPSPPPPTTASVILHPLPPYKPMLIRKRRAWRGVSHTHTHTLTHPYIEAVSSS